MKAEAPSCKSRSINVVRNNIFLFKNAEKGTHNFAHDSLDELNESQLLRMRTLGDRVVDVLGELGDDFRVGVRFKDVATTLQESLELGVVGDDTVVDLWESSGKRDQRCSNGVRMSRSKTHDDEFVGNVTAVRVRVAFRRDTVGSPASVGNARVLGKQLLLLGLVHDVVDLFPERLDTADLFENPDVFGVLSFNSETWN